MKFIYTLVMQSATQEQENFLRAHRPNPKYANAVPVNFKEITEKEFVEMNTFTYMPSYVDSVQAHIDGDDKAMVEIMLFVLNDNTGYGLARDYSTRKLRYFKFGCSHDYKNVNSSEELAARFPQHAGRYISGSHIHNLVCADCGHLRIIDSSD